MGPVTFKKAAEAAGWSKYPDFVGKAKRVGSYTVELLGGTDRGAMINMWLHERSDLPHIWTPSDDDEWMKFAEGHFMRYSNALEEYRAVKTTSDVLALALRCS